MTKKFIHLNHDGSEDMSQDALIHFNLPKKKTKNHLPKITKIQAQKKSGRYNIFIDHQFAFGIDESILVKYQLQKGMEISQTLQEEIRANEKVEQAYQKVLNYLNYGLRTEKEIKNYLASKDFSAEVPAAIARLKQLKLIDDLNYAESFVRTEARISKKGPLRIFNDLSQKGIASDLIEQALTEYSWEWQLKNAKELAIKYFEKQRKVSEREAINKTSRYLKRKGYAFSLIQQVVDSLHFEIPEADEYESLKKLGRRNFKKHQRNKKNDAYAIKQKTKAYLFRKGFPGHLIDQFIEEMDE